MKVGKYRIWWHYGDRDDNTYCIIREEGSTHPDIIGIAFKNPKDAYDKEKGRKKSLLRAMKNHGFTKLYRKEIWEAYRTMTKKERW